ncbi:MAG: hypothetical protein GF344_00530 [Chitinivibrionales bacterium]|nr:hypothetical protein [Chitinivibrionales bacterium]MBD3355613.1 hypothetical protein [Chitinivibrionales bacterium]
MGISIQKRKKAIRKRARLAYEQEMKAHQRKLKERFAAYSRGEIEPAQLIKGIDDFHQKIVREREAFWEDPNPENVLGWAAAHRIVSDERVIEDITQTIGRAAKSSMSIGVNY